MPGVAAVPPPNTTTHGVLAKEGNRGRTGDRGELKPAQGGGQSRWEKGQKGVQFYGPPGAVAEGEPGGGEARIAEEEGTDGLLGKSKMWKGLPEESCRAQTRGNWGDEKGDIGVWV